MKKMFYLMINIRNKNSPTSCLLPLGHISPTIVVPPLNLVKAPFLLQNSRQIKQKTQQFIINEHHR